MPVPSGSPCQASKGRLKKLDSVLGHSWALFLSQGGMCDSPSSEWEPLTRQRRKQSHHCAQEGSPRGSRLQPAPRGGALHKPPTRKGQAEGRQGNGQSTGSPGPTARPGPERPNQKFVPTHLMRPSGAGSQGTMQPPWHSALPVASFDASQVNPHQSQSCRGGIQLTFRQGSTH